MQSLLTNISTHDLQSHDAQRLTDQEAPMLNTLTLSHGIPQIKRFMAGDDAAIPAGIAPADGASAGRVIVIGAGAAGLAAALHLQVYLQALML